MKKAVLKSTVLGAMLGIALLVSGIFATDVSASTGFVDNSYSDSTPYGFTWTSTNSASIDATDSTQGMFEFNYTTISGSDWNTDLGQPTTYDGAVDINVFNANVRADKNAALNPPEYGVFSGEFMTDATNPYFSQPVSPDYWYVTSDESPNGVQIYDTLQHGANSQQPILGQQSQLSVNPDGEGGFLPPTSVGE